MTRLMLIRYLALGLPLVAVVAAARLASVPAGGHPGPVDRGDAGARQRELGAALLALVAAAVGISGLDALGQHLGWYAWATLDGAFRGMPVDLWLGWALLWGPLPVLLRRWLPVPVALGGLLWLNLVTMPVLHPVVLRLGPHWWVGELLGLLAVALPATLLGRWVADRRHLAARTGLQLLTFAGLTVWLLPTVAIAAGDGSWTPLIRAPSWQLSLLIQVAALVSVPGVLAVREFAERGGGTPYPWDPPRRLVTTGPYAYVANPMQLSAALLLLVLAGATRSWTVAATALSVVAFCGFVAGPHEHQQLTARYGAELLAYRARVRLWWPRWRPYRRGDAELYLARDCRLCESTRVWLASHHPTGLLVRPAPGRLRRARYRHAGYAVDGVAAVARATEHANLWWAYAGWLLRLPLLDRFVQLLADGLGAGPRTISTPGGEDRPDLVRPANGEVATAPCRTPGNV